MAKKSKKTKNQKEIDNVAVEAKKSGMSYGQYVAMLYADRHRIHFSDPKDEILH